VTPKAISALLDRPIAFHRPFVQITGSINSALMLSQALYWSHRTPDKNGWFYKTRDEWEEETALTRTEQENARRLLRETGFWKEELRGVPAKMHYRIDFEMLAAYMDGNLPTGRKENRPSSGKETGSTRRRETRQHITETTTETTSESTTSSSGASPEAPELVLASEEPTLNQQIWDKYEKAYRRRYHVPPVRNKKLTARSPSSGSGSGKRRRK